MAKNLWQYAVVTRPAHLETCENVSSVHILSSGYKGKGKTKYLFEADIMLSNNDKKIVDTSATGDSNGAKVDVESIGQKRKAIRTRRKIWPSRSIPVEATIDVGELMKSE